MLVIEQKVITALKANAGTASTAEAIAAKLSLEPQVELIFKLLIRLAANNRGVSSNTKNPIHETEFFSA